MRVRERGCGCGGKRAGWGEGIVSRSAIADEERWIGIDTEVGSNRGDVEVGLIVTCVVVVVGGMREGTRCECECECGAGEVGERGGTVARPLTAPMRAWSSRNRARR